MKAVIQRVNFAKLRIDQQVFSKIKTGLVVLVGITHDDDIDDIKSVSYTHLTLPTKA